MMLKVLERYGAPPKLRSAISRMYQYLKVILKIVKIEEKISQTLGVRKSDCMALVLFLFMVMAFSETLETEWIKADLKIINLRQHTHSSRDVGKLIGHKKNKPEQGTLPALFCVLYVDDGAFTFENRDQLTRGLNLIYQHFAKFGLEMHIGKGKKASKTECVFFHPPGSLRWKCNLLNKNNKRKRKMLVRETNQESHETRNNIEETTYDNLPETRLIIVKDGFVTFCRHFKYLGSCISFSLR